jgi:hypothetical protein
MNFEKPPENNTNSDKDNFFEDVGGKYGMAPEKVKEVQDMFSAIKSKNPNKLQLELLKVFIDSYIELQQKETPPNAFWNKEANNESKP